jgi:hypothetical protein
MGEQKILKKCSEHESKSETPKREPEISIGTAVSESVT